MARDEFIIDEGVVLEALPNATFRVEVAGQAELIFCHLSGKMRKNFIKVLPGDRVLFEMSPYDLSKGRITRRLKPGEVGIEKPTVTPQASTEPAAEQPDMSKEQPSEDSHAS